MKDKVFRIGGLIFMLLVALVMWRSIAKPIPEEEPLVFVVIPAEAALLTTEQFAPLVDYLAEQIGRPIELMTAADYTAVVEAMKYGHADIARFGAFAYVLATQEADVEALVVAIKKKTGTTSYRAFIVAREDITDFNGKSFSYTDVGSTSGYLVPATYIQLNGIELGEIFFAGSHGASIEAVRNGTVDLAAVADNRYHTAIEEGIITEDELVIVWQSEPIANAPIAVQADMDDDLKAQLAAAFISAPKEVVEATMVGETGYVVATDSDYDPVREIQETLQ